MTDHRYPETIDAALVAINGWASLTDEQMPDNCTPPTPAHIAEATTLVRTAYDRLGILPSFLVPYQCEWDVGDKEFEVNFDGDDHLTFLIDHTPTISRQQNPAKYTLVKDVPLATVIDALAALTSNEKEGDTL